MHAGQRSSSFRKQVKVVHNGEIACAEKTSVHVAHDHLA